MTNLFLIILAYSIAIIGGAGVYVLTPTLMNLVVIVAIFVFLWTLIKQYHHRGPNSIYFDVDKIVVLLLYIGFLVGNLLKEAIVDTEFQFADYDPEISIFRQYTDLFRGLIAFFAATIVYTRVKNEPIVVYLPLAALTVVLSSIFLEAYGYVNAFGAQDMADAWGATPMDKLLARPGGFLNPNMTSAVALLWLYVALESEQRTPLLIKGACLVMALAVVTLAQSRGALLLLSFYIIHTLIISRNISFFVVLVFGGIGIAVILSYADMDIVNSIIEKFTDRATHKEESAAEREYLIYRAVDEFQRSPIAGNGLYYLYKIYGVSSHNQTLEILCNFGLIGFFVYFYFYLTYYHENKLGYMLLCVLPMFLFSHNFFENSAFQVAIGFAHAQAKTGLKVGEESSTNQYNFAQT